MAPPDSKSRSTSPTLAHRLCRSMAPIRRRRSGMRSRRKRRHAR